MKKGFINGCFDILHLGHIQMLRFARTKCDYLIVALDSDERVASLKGPERPYNCLEDRMAMMRALKSVDEVRSFSTAPELENLIKDINPDIMVVGAEYENKKVVGGEHAKELLFFRRIDGYSTTNILENTVNR